MNVVDCNNEIKSACHVCTVHDGVADAHDRLAIVALCAGVAVPLSCAPQNVSFTLDSTITVH